MGFLDLILGKNREIPQVDKNKLKPTADILSHVLETKFHPTFFEGNSAYLSDSKIVGVLKPDANLSFRKYLEEVPYQNLDYNQLTIGITGNQEMVFDAELIKKIIMEFKPEKIFASKIKPTPIIFEIPQAIIIVAPIIKTY